MSEAHDLWRYAPKVEGDLATRRHWIIVTEPGCVPEKKGGFTHDQVSSFLRELVECRPAGTDLTVVSLTWDFDLWVESGRMWLVGDEVFAEMAGEESEGCRNALSE